MVGREMQREVSFAANNLSALSPHQTSTSNFTNFTISTNSTKCTYNNTLTYLHHQHSWVLQFLKIQDGRIPKFKSQRLQLRRPNPPQTTLPIPPSPHYPNFHTPPREPRPASHQRIRIRGPQAHTFNPRPSTGQRQHPLRRKDNNLPTKHPIQAIRAPQQPNIPLSNIHQSKFYSDCVESRRQPQHIR